jgi:hypothetical protein
VQNFPEKLRAERDSALLQQQLSQAEQDLHNVRAQVVELQETTLAV